MILPAPATASTESSSTPPRGVSGSRGRTAPVRRAGRWWPSWSAGHVAGVDISGLAVLAAGERDVLGGPLRRLVLVDERATPEQVRVLVDLMAGRLGGLGMALGGPADDDLGVYQAPTEWAVAPERATVLVRGHLQLSVDAGSADMVLDVPEHHLCWEEAGCHALRGEIHVAAGGRR